MRVRFGPFRPKAPRDDSRRQLAHTPAVDRLRRIRWGMTVLFALTTCFCLAVLAFVATRIDSTSRRTEVSDNVRAKALALARTAYFDRGKLHLEYLDDDQVATGARGIVVLEGPAVVFAQPDIDAAPSQTSLQRAYREVGETQDVAVFTADSRAGIERTWAAAPVWNDDVIGAVLFVGADPSVGQAEHQRLVDALLIGSLALVVVSALAAHVLSGRAMRPAVQGIAQQEQFLSEAAHELRTPLATLKVVVDDGLDHTQRAGSALASASQLVVGMDKIVHGLLSRARLRSGIVAMEQELIRLDQLVEQVVEETPGTDRIAVDTSPTIVRGDADLLGQAIRNLVDNALRHGGDVVRVDVARGTVAVSDNGVGLDAHQRARAFGRGVSFGGGTGTGLSIVSWVAELHDGTAELTDAVDGGLCARLVLPEAR